MLNLDPWTVLWTGINLVVLYLLMRHFLFKPVTAMMEQRTKAIEDGLSQAEAAKQAAQALDQENEARLAQVRGQADQIVAQAKLQGQREYDQIISSAQADAQAIRAEIERAVLEVYRALGMRDCGCIDLIWDGAQAIILQATANPNFAAEAPFAQAAKAAGLTLPNLLNELAESALDA